MSKNIIKNVELEIDGKIIKLTLDQAKKLKSALDELFGKDVEVKKEYIPYPVWPYRRWYDWTYKWDTYKTDSDVTCKYQSNNNTLKLSL